MSVSAVAVDTETFKPDATVYYVGSVKGDRAQSFNVTRSDALEKFAAEVGANKPQFDSNATVGDNVVSLTDSIRARKAAAVELGRKTFGSSTQTQDITVTPDVTALALERATQKFGAPLASQSADEFAVQFVPSHAKGPRQLS